MFESQTRDIVPRSCQSLALPCASTTDLQLSLEKFRRKPATRRFDESFAPLLRCEERFARQYPFGPPPGFRLASSSPSKDHRLSGLYLPALPPKLQPKYQNGGSVAPDCSRSQISLSLRLRVFTLYDLQASITPWSVFQDGPQKNAAAHSTIPKTSECFTITNQCKHR